MIIKTDKFKLRRGCRTCRYEEKSRVYSACCSCEFMKGTNWTKPVEKCECCGQEVE